MVERNEAPKRGRKMKRPLAEIAKEQYENYDPTSVEVNKYGAGFHVGYGVMGFHKISHRRRDGDLPPAKEDPRGWTWKRADLSSMLEMERLGFWERWKTLRKKFDEDVAWDVMLQLLRNQKTEIELKAEKVLAGLNSEGIA